MKTPLTDNLMTQLQNDITIEYQFKCMHDHAKKMEDKTYKLLKIIHNQKVALKNFKNKCR